MKYFGECFAPRRPLRPGQLPPPSGGRSNATGMQVTSRRGSDTEWCDGESVTRDCVYGPMTRE